MEPLNATELRVTRRGTIGPCKCKVGSCRKCGSKCKRCKCQCDGFSILDTLKRMRSQKEKDVVPRRRKMKAPKRMKAVEKLIKEPVRSSRRGKPKRSWAHLMDDDSTYNLPSVGTNIETNEDEDDEHVDSSNLIVVMRLLLDTETLKTAIDELGKTISSVSLPANKQTLKKLFVSALEINSIEYSDSSGKTLLSLHKILHLPYESSNDVQQLLMSSLTKKKRITFNIKLEICQKILKGNK